MEDRRYLVVGARGLVGRAVLSALEAEDRAEVIGLSRRQPDFPTRARWIPCDLTDRDACHAALGAAQTQGVTHIVYAALQEMPDLISGWRDPVQIETNARMLANLLEFVQPREHFTLLQGTKAYGAHLAPMALPGKESAPRHPGENFYWEQEDLMRSRQAGSSWAFSIVRPQIVCGVALGSPMNMVAAIGVYAAVMRQLGKPLCFPGCGGFVTEATDADLLARAIIWAGREPACANEILNVTNGDVLDWVSLWPAFGEIFQMPTGEADPMRLAISMPELSGVWDEVVGRHGLKSMAMAELVGDSWQFADAVFGYGGGARSTLLSTIKIRQLGFHECIDTEQMFRNQLAALQDLKVLPR
jgi:nucleoside-diphosphate-sugar epimerase